MTGTGTAEDPYIITSVADLDDVNDDLDAYYELGADIDCGGSEYIIGSWSLVNPDYSTVENTLLTPPYTVYYLHVFTGSFDGKGYTISNLTINESTWPNNACNGLFRGISQGATLQNVILTGSSVTASGAGANAGYFVGSLVGYAFGSSTITKCEATGSVSGVYWCGGLVGNLYQVTVSQCYANVDTTGSIIGGLAGASETTTISNCYSLGDITGGIFSGGFIGFSTATDSVSNCYSAGSVSGASDVGGFIGSAGDPAVVTGCYWDTETSGQATSGAGTGKTTTQMKTQSTFSGWDFTTIWGIDGSTNSGYPYLLWSIAASITTVAASSITATSAILHGTESGMTTIYFQYSQGENSLIHETSQLSATASFYRRVDGLIPSMTYYFRAAGVVGESTTYGSVLNFTTLAQTSVPETPTLKYGYMWNERTAIHLRDKLDTSERAFLGTVV